MIASGAEQSCFEKGVLAVASDEASHSGERYS